MNGQARLQEHRLWLIEARGDESLSPVHFLPPDMQENSRLSLALVLLNKNTLVGLAASNPELALALQTIRMRALLRQHLATASQRPADAVAYRSEHLHCASPSSFYISKAFVLLTSRCMPWTTTSLHAQQPSNLLLDIYNTSAIARCSCTTSQMVAPP